MRDEKSNPQQQQAKRQVHSESPPPPTAVRRNSIPLPKARHFFEMFILALLFATFFILCRPVETPSDGIPVMTETPTQSAPRFEPLSTSNAPPSENPLIDALAELVYGLVELLVALSSLVAAFTNLLTALARLISTSLWELVAAIILIPCSVLFTQFIIDTQLEPRIMPWARRKGLELAGEQEERVGYR